MLHADELKEGGSEKAALLLVEQARKTGLQKFWGEGQPQRYLRRREAALAVDASLVLPDAQEVEAYFLKLAGMCRSFEDLKAADPMGSLMASVDARSKQRLEELAPKNLKLPSGRQTSVQYEEGKPPWAQGFMQDFFGLKDLPPGMVVHLLGPSRRPVQVTADLAGFWINHYPALRSELGRKHPRHYWPEDPLNADPKLLKRHLK